MNIVASGSRPDRPTPALWLVLIAMVVPTGSSMAADATETSGDVLRVLIPAAAVAVAWRRDDDAGIRQFARAFVGAVGTTYVLKPVVDQERPNGGSNGFPSGHATTAFAGAAFLHRRYGWRDAWWAYALAGWTGWTRIDADEHDLGDVLGGAAVAIAWNWWQVSRWEKVDLQPTLEADAVALRLTGRW
jgi:membrane-associated phospholipid phosphatase